MMMVGEPASRGFRGCGRGSVMRGLLWGSMLIVGLCAADAGAQTIHVDADALPGGNGQSWSNAYRYLHDALAYAEDPSHGVTELRIAGGVYVPDRSESMPGGAGNRNATFSLVDGVALRGGYAGLGAPNPDARDIQLYETILSGDLLGNDGPNFTNYEDNAYSVIRATSVGEVILDGITVTAGNANGNGSPNHVGGGAHLTDINAMIVNCIFRDNAAKYGGGIYLDAGSVDVLSCLFMQNSADGHGGSIRARQSTLTVDLCEFRENNSGTGAGIALLSSELHATSSIFIDNIGDVGVAVQVDTSCCFLTDCDFINNIGAASGAVTISNACTSGLTRCTFENNTAGLVGGALNYGAGPDPTPVVDCLFINNSATMIGGAAITGGHVEWINCVFGNNSAPAASAMLISHGSLPTFNNCTIANNSGIAFATGPANGAASGSSNLILRNSILWGNETPFADNLMNNVDITFSNVEGDWAGTGNIDENPLFVQPGTGDFRLAFGSPCVDAGSNALIPPGITTDAAGEARIQNDVVDMGAYEGEYEPLPPAASAVVNTGQFTFLAPLGDEFEFAEPFVLFSNLSGPNGATVTVTLPFEPDHENAPGYDTVGDMMTLETSLEDGQYRAVIFLPFTSSQIPGINAPLVDAARHDADLDRWTRAVNANVQNHPGGDSPLGTRVILIDNDFNVGSTALGNFGVMWNPLSGQGVAWASVDAAGDYRVGVNECMNDTAHPQNGAIDVLDALAVLKAWLDQDSPHDVNVDGAVTVTDLFSVLDAWGVCP